MDIDAMFDQALEEVVKRQERRAKSKKKVKEAAKVIAKRRKPAIPVPRKLKNPQAIAQVVFFEQFQCRCGSVHTAPQYSGALYIKMQLTSNTHAFDYIPAKEFKESFDTSDLPQITEMKYSTLPFCPACAHAEVEDPFLIRAFEIEKPTQSSFDFDKWLYPTDKFPLMVIYDN